MMQPSPTTPTAPPHRVAAVLFDMDDTLVDSEQAWFDATADLWTEAGGDPTGKGVLGGTVADIVEQFLLDFPTADPTAVGVRLQERLAAHLDGAVVPMPGAAELLARFTGRIPMTIASNSPSALVQQVVAALGWGSFFTAALGTDDVAASKPAPDLYLAAAERCGVDIADCVVFEDSPMGTRAGRASGAFVVTVGAAAAGHGHLSVESLLDPVVVEWQPTVIA